MTSTIGSERLSFKSDVADSLTSVGEDISFTTKKNNDIHKMKVNVINFQIMFKK